MLKASSYLSIGQCTGSNYTIESKVDAKPYHAKPCPISNIHNPTLKKEVNRLINTGVFKKINNSQLAAPTLIKSKKNCTVRFISDFRELSKRMKRKHFPIPKYSRFIT